MIVEAPDLGGSSPGDGFHGRDDFVCRYFLDAIFVVGFGIRLFPAVPRCPLVCGADKRKMPVGIFLFLSRRSRAAVVFDRASTTLTGGSDGGDWTALPVGSLPRIAGQLPFLNWLELAGLRSLPSESSRKSSKKFRFGSTSPKTLRISSSTTASFLAF